MEPSYSLSSLLAYHIYACRWCLNPRFAQSEYPELKSVFEYREESVELLVAYFLNGGFPSMDYRRIDLS